MDHADDSRLTCGTESNRLHIGDSSGDDTKTILSHGSRKSDIPKHHCTNHSRRRRRCDWLIGWKFTIRQNNGSWLNMAGIEIGVMSHQRLRGYLFDVNAVGISSGGRATEIHTLVDGLGNSLAFLLSPGNEYPTSARPDQHCRQ